LSRSATGLARVRDGRNDAFLRPATITLQRVVQIGGECCVGNAGLDLLTRQSSSVTIDLTTMTLHLQSPLVLGRAKRRSVSQNSTTLSEDRSRIRAD
jgi:hypothetical protein